MITKTAIQHYIEQKFSFWPNFIKKQTNKQTKQKQKTKNILLKVKTLSIFAEHE